MNAYHFASAVAEWVFRDPVNHNTILDQIQKSINRMLRAIIYDCKQDQVSVMQYLSIIIT